MTLLRPLFAGCTALLLVLSGPATTAQNQSAPAAAAAGSEIDDDARMALTRMGTALRSHNIFVLNADVTTEDVLGSGEKLQFAGTIQVQARKPDRFKISAVSDIQDRQIYYDGKTVTIFSPRLSLYGIFPAQPTIAQTLAVARERYDVQMPLSDLFTWGTDDAQFARLTSGFLVRPEKIEGKSCNHYAFRQDGADWQIWIAEDVSALPCKLIITNTEDDSRPQFSAVMRWTFPNTIADDTFAFTPPAGSGRVVVVDLDAAR